MKIYKLTYTEIDTKNKLAEDNKKVTFQFAMSEEELEALKEEYKEAYITFIKEKLFIDTAKAVDLTEPKFN